MRYTKVLRRPGDATLINGVFVRRIRQEPAPDAKNQYPAHDRLEIGQPGSGHTLAVDSTDDERLEAHVANHESGVHRPRRFYYPKLIPIEVGDYLGLDLNQAIRDCEFIMINKTRARVAYEMPNAGDMEGWQPVWKARNGQAYLIKQEYR